MDDSFKRRQDVFYSGLIDLVRSTGVALTSSSALGAWGEIQMVDTRDQRGGYLRDDDCLAWHPTGDYSEPPGRIEALRTLIASLTDAEWEEARPRMCRGCLDRLDEGEKCYCMADV